ncbi:hypothetical protein JZ751_007206 [Albula glossodonta]|uniref:Uncharacterized protein n=1 Tax=Albula glossodonta TaxID=121402 RepID=A0A8T2PDN8_9TELE|nr:hypothetical protein JZ751_007206 [Albula glossodonta]
MLDVSPQWQPSIQVPWRRPEPGTVRAPCCQASVVLGRAHGALLLLLESSLSWQDILIFQKTGKSPEVRSPLFAAAVH